MILSLTRNNKYNQKNETPEGPDPEQEKKAFKYMLDGEILDFQFVSEKRVKCPKCKKEYKNILLHLQKSSCKISNLDDLGEKFKEQSLFQSGTQR